MGSLFPKPRGSGLGVPNVLAPGQGGLFDLALHPNFAENRLIYFTDADGTSDADRTHMARATWEGEQLRDWERIEEAGG